MIDLTSKNESAVERVSLLELEREDQEHRVHQELEVYQQMLDATKMVPGSTADWCHGIDARELHWTVLRLSGENVANTAVLTQTGL